MKSILTLITLTTGLTFSSCERNNSNLVYPFEAKVLGLNNDCGIYEIKFTADLAGVIEKVGRSPVDSIYIAKNLPNDLKVQGINIILDFRKPLESELTNCTTMGPNLTWLYVTNAKLK